MKLKFYLNKVMQLPPHILLKKIALMLKRALTHRWEKYRLRLISSYLTDQQLLRAIGPAYTSIDNFLCHIQQRQNPKFFYEPRHSKELVALLKRIKPRAHEEIISEADEVCHHQFDLLGSGKVELDVVSPQEGKRYKNCIDWQLDFKSGYRWDPNTFYKEVKFGHQQGVDIKVPWELSRFQHVAVLGQAYWITQDEKYAREYVMQVEDWIEHNPPKLGVNWVNAMEVGIRAVNWIIGYQFFKCSGVLTDIFLKRLLKSLISHGRYIRSNLEWSQEATSNHYLSDIVGLIFLGCFLPEIREAQEWLEFGMEQLVSEMERQVYDDGVDYEASTGYHRLVLELFFSAAWLCKLNHRSLPEPFWDKLKKMFEFVLYYLKPDGKAPQFGDNDSGRLFKFKRREVLDHRYLLSVAAVVFEDNQFRRSGDRFDEEALWLLGEKSYQTYMNLPVCPQPLRSRAFRGGGIYIMRHHKNYLALVCGPNGMDGNGGHTHNDKLSFELCIAGQSLIVDPGSYLYTPTPQERNLFRSTGFHNTVVVGEHEQNRLDTRLLFYIYDDTTCRCLCWNSTDVLDQFVGEHNGYQRLKVPTVHRRKIRFVKNKSEWWGEDVLLTSKKLNERYVATFILAPEITPLIDSSNTIIFQKNRSDLAYLRLNNAQRSVEITQKRYSKGYGEKAPTAAIQVFFAQRNLSWVIGPMP